MTILSILLFLGACLGHVAVLIRASNWWYGSSLDHYSIKVVRAGHSLLVLVGWVLFWQVLRPDRAGSFYLDQEQPWMLAVQVYALVCCGVAYLWLPLVTVGRLARQTPVLVHNHTRTVDVAAALGYKPVGRGRHQLTAQLPGNNVFQVDFAEKTLSLPQLPPAWDGLTILHLSDLHFRDVPAREFFAHVMDECRAWDPDLVALTGDFVDSPTHHRWIIPILGRLRWRVGAFAVLGNHDTWFDPTLVRRRLARLNIDVVGNGWRQLEVRGAPLLVIGNETPWIGPAPDLSACPEGVFRLCLSHTPDTIRWARRHAIDLMLAGHNHGGQVRFPVIGSVFVPSRYGRRYDGGLYEESPTVLHVSRGLSGKQPLRYNCRPEVTKIILRRGRAEDERAG